MEVGDIGTSRSSRRGSKHNSWMDLAGDLDEAATLTPPVSHEVRRQTQSPSPRHQPH